MNDLTKAGFKLVYNYTYSHVTTSEEIIDIRSQCSVSTIICVGGNRFDEIHLRVLACANCFNVTSQFLSNQPLFYEGGAYWYFKDGESFGFAPIVDTIEQNSSGLIGQSSNFTLSWHLNDRGGGTLGTLTDLRDDTNYYKNIYINSA
jgi:hypothetical protein